MAETQQWARLLEIVEGIKRDTVRKLDELEQRFQERAGMTKKDMAELMNLVYTLSNAVSLTYHLLVMAEIARSPKDIEENIVRALRLWKEVTRSTKEVFGIVDWSLLQDKAEIILRVAKRRNIPFNTIAMKILETMGNDAAKFVKEDSVMNCYGIAATYEWRRLALR